MDQKRYYGLVTKWFRHDGGRELGYGIVEWNYGPPLRCYGNAIGILKPDIGITFLVKRKHDQNGKQQLECIGVKLFF